MTEFLLSPCTVVSYMLNDLISSILAHMLKHLLVWDGGSQMIHSDEIEIEKRKIYLTTNNNVKVKKMKNEEAVVCSLMSSPSDFDMDY